MKKLVIIGANDFQNQLILKAKLLGYETHVFAWEEGAIGRDSADFFYPISIIEKEKILDICRKIEPDGVCSIASDLAAITVNYVAEGLGLTCNATKYSQMQTNKYAMRMALAENGIPCPRFIVVEETFSKEGLEQFRFPIIVKPTDRSGSRCITELYSFEGIEAAVKNACDVSFEHRAIIEEFISGDEYSMETISWHGEHSMLAITKKYTTGSPDFIETGHVQPSDLSHNIQRAARQMIFNALDALHIENSAGHAEFRVDQQGNIHIIEIGARMGGDCIGSDLVYLSTGNDFMKMVIDVACGLKPEINRKSLNKKAEIHFIFNESDMDDYKKIEKEEPDRIYRTSRFEMENLGKAKDSSTRVGYYILREKF